ncbi:MAG: RNA polymerase sigma factor [Planctomycetes bacterium]|nr:RNA polymerase sigma factor [Planctomycetota bacterium]
MSRLLLDMQPRLRAFLGSLAAADVDDLVQETLTRAWRSRTRLDAARGSGEAWLLRIAFRTFLDHRRRCAQVIAQPAAPEDEQAAVQRDPHQQAAIREHTTALLGSLSRCEHDILLRFHRDGDSIEDIARALRMPPGTVKSHLHRARNRLWAMERQRGADR